MNILNFKKKIFSIFLAFMFFMLQLTANSQVSIGGANFGNSFARGTLTKTMTGKSLSRIAFVGSVGGAALDSVLKLGHGVKAETLSIYYKPGKPDGKRLTLKLDNNSYPMEIYDWQLIPIAKYSDSKYNSCVSLFGPETTEKEYHIVYHKAFTDTLLGLRLLQADILLMDMTKFWDLPKNTTTGRYYLAEEGGETAPKLTLEIISAASDLSKLKQQYSDKFQSWVLTDQDTNVILNKNPKNSLYFSGKPYYHFWKAKKPNPNKLYGHAEMLYKNGDPQIKHYFKSIYYAKNNKQKQQISERLFKYTYDKMDKKGEFVYIANELIDKFKAKMHYVETVNPAVYKAVKNTMHYSALFRYVKQNNPSNWRAFKNSINNVTVENIITPTSWKKKSKKAQN